MNFTLASPCGTCPFRKDRPGFLSEERAEDIIDSLYRRDGSFPCHKTFTYEEDEAVYTERTQHCAGAMILMERSGRANQIMRIGERLGFYDRTKLDMTAPVFLTSEEFIEHHAESDRYPTLQG